MAIVDYTVGMRVDENEKREVQEAFRTARLNVAGKVWDYLREEAKRIKEGK